MARKSARHGQNFLIDQRIADRILSAGSAHFEAILEIGPGKGILTEALLKNRTDSIAVHAVEIDRELAQALRLKWPSLHLHEGDVLDIDPNRLDIRSPFLLISNLPYDISRPFFERLVEWVDVISQAVIMVQKEFADKICLDHKRSALGNMLAALYHVDRLFTVPPGAFRPMPKVYSSVLRLTPVPKPMKPAERQRHYRFLKLCFSSPRKTLHNNLRGHWAGELERALTTCGIAATARAEDLAPSDFHRLWLLLEGHQDRPVMK